MESHAPLIAGPLNEYWRPLKVCFDSPLKRPKGGWIRGTQPHTTGEKGEPGISLLTNPPVLFEILLSIPIAQTLELNKENWCIHKQRVPPGGKR